MLSGDLVSLPVETEEEFKKEYMLKYVKPEYQPFVTLHIEDGMLMVNLHPILPELEGTINWEELSKNSAAIHFLEEHLDRVNWSEFSANPAAIEVLKKHRDKIDFNGLSRNPSLEAEELFLEYIDKIYWCSVARNHPRANVLLRDPFFVIDFCHNPYATPDWIEDNLELLSRSDWVVLCSKPSMVELLKRYPDRIEYDRFAANPAAAEYLLEHKDEIETHNILYNPSSLIHDHIEEFRLPLYITSGLFFMDAPAIVNLLDRMPLEDIDWNMLCYNPNPRVLEFLEKHIDRVRDYKYLVYNNGARNLIPRYIKKIIDSTPKCYRALSLMTIYSIPTIMCPDSSNF
jgi:hypothetical protein